MKNESENARIHRYSLSLLFYAESQYNNLQEQWEIQYVSQHMDLDYFPFCKRT